MPTVTRKVSPSPSLLMKPKLSVVWPRRCQQERLQFLLSKRGTSVSPMRRFWRGRLASMPRTTCPRKTPPTHGKAKIMRKHRQDGTKVECTEICTALLSKQTAKGRRPGFCVNIGASRSVVGLKEARRIYKRIGRRLQLNQ